MESPPVPSPAPLLPPSPASPGPSSFNFPLSPPPSRLFLVELSEEVGGTITTIKLNAPWNLGPPLGPAQKPLLHEALLGSPLSHLEAVPFLCVAGAERLAGPSVRWTPPFPPGTGLLCSQLVSPTSTRAEALRGWA